MLQNGINVCIFLANSHLSMNLKLERLFNDQLVFIYIFNN